MTDEDPMPKLRNRAYQLADTGRFPTWSDVAAELVKEGAHDVLVRRLGYDAFFNIMIKNRIAAAR